MNINYQFNTTLLQADKSLYAITAEHCVEIINRQHLLLSHTQQQTAVVLEQYLGSVLEILQSFRTLSGHADEIKSFMQLDNSADNDIRQVLNHLKDNGFLVSAQEALQLARTNTSAKPLQRPPVVVVRTAGRVSMFKRFLQSAAENEYRFNARYDYLVIDDSTTEQAEANAVNIADSGLQITHVDKTKQQEILQTLLEKFPEHRQSIDFLLGEHSLHQLSPTYGRTWNWGVLLSAGQATVFLDDDCLLHAYQSPLPVKNTLAFAKANQSVQFLSKEKTLDEQLQRLNLDPIAQLASVLGLTPAQLACDENSFADADYRVTKKLPTARVMMSSQAIAGDPGSANPIWLYYLQGENIKRFYGDDEDTYNRHKSERFLWVGDTSPTFAFGGVYSVVARGFDNRELLPPTLPIFRNEDALFTDLMHYLHPDAATTHLPWTLAHLPESERRWQDSDSKNPKGFDVVMAIDSITEETTTAPLTAAARLQHLGRQLQAVFSQDDSGVQRWMYVQQQRARASQLRLLQNAIDNNPDAPDYWQADVSDMIVNNTQAQQPLICGEQSPEDLVAAMQLFATALPAWADLWQHAQENSLL